jgi:anti-sigma28 factor (negative regulator of flagellin synthesis)
MKINDLSHNISNLGNLETTANKQKEEQRNAIQVTSNIVHTDAKVDFSNTSVEYSRAAEKMEEIPEDMTNKIEILKMMVNNNAYNVDSAKIAEKIINDFLFDALEP